MSKKAEIIYRNAARELRRRTGDIYRKAMKELRREGCEPLMPGNDFAAALEMAATVWKDEVQRVFKDFKGKQATYEPLFSMPPARRERSTASKPLTLVERRAVAAKAKVREWQRKSKLAATKIKQYQKKVKYYTKKGVVS